MHHDMDYGSAIEPDVSFGELTVPIESNLQELADRYVCKVIR